MADKEETSDKAPSPRSPRGKDKDPAAPTRTLSFGFLKRSAPGTKDAQRYSSDSVLVPPLRKTEQPLGSSAGSISPRKSDIGTGTPTRKGAAEVRARNNSAADVSPRGGGGEGSPRKSSPRKTSPREQEPPRKGKRNVGKAGWLRQKLVV